MADPNQIEPEHIATGTGVVGALIIFFRWLFTSKELKREVDEVKSTLSSMGNTLTDMNLKLAILTESKVTREEFEELRRDVTKLKSDYDHMREQLQQGVVPP